MLPSPLINMSVAWINQTFPRTIQRRSHPRTSRCLFGVTLFLTISNHFVLARENTVPSLDKEGHTKTSAQT
jgi:hypothetical protein